MIDLRTKRKRVLALHEKGHDAVYIAQVSDLTKTQVELILIAWAPRGTE